MVISLRSRHDTLSVALLEDTLFLSPPNPTPASDSAVEPSPATLARQAQSEPSNDPILRGQITLVNHAPRKARKIRVQLIGRSAAHGGDGSLSYEATTTLEKNLEIDLKGERLEKGTHSWDFSFIVPSTTAVGERSVYGSIRHSVRATLYGAGNTRDLSSAVQPLWLIANPSPEGELPSGLEIDVRHNGILRSLESDTEDLSLGPIALHVSSPHLTVASLLFLSITFERPPEGLKIMSVSAYIKQTFDISFTDEKILPVRQPVQKKLLFYVDSTSPIAASTDDLLDRPNLGRGTLPPLAYEPRAFLAQPLARLEGGQEWTYARVSRVPDDDAVRPSTLAGTNTPIRVKHQLVVQVKYRLKGSKKDLILEMSSPVTIASCCCLQSSLLLPRYRSHNSSHHPSHHGQSSSLSRADPSNSSLVPADHQYILPFHRRCLCNTPLQALVDQEGEKLCGAAEMRSRSRSNSHSRSVSRARGDGSTGFGFGGGAVAGGDDATSDGARGRAWHRKAGESYPVHAPAYDEGRGITWEGQGNALRPAPGPSRLGRS